MINSRGTHEVNLLKVMHLKAYFNEEYLLNQRPTSIWMWEVCHVK